MTGAVIGIVGQSGTGKTYSLRNIPQDKLLIVDVERKGMPFHTARPECVVQVKTHEEFRRLLQDVDNKPVKPEVLVIDSFTALANYMETHAALLNPSRAGDGSFALWRTYNEFIQLNIESFKAKPYNVVLIGIDEVLSTTGTDGSLSVAQRRMKVGGKKWEGAIESHCLVVLGTRVIQTAVGRRPEYKFQTFNDGVLTCKCPPWITEELLIDNDLWPILQKIKAGPPAGGTK